MKSVRLKSLSAHFIAVGGLVMLAAMLIAGSLITTVVTAGALREKAASTALFMQAIAGDLVPQLAKGEQLSPEVVSELDRLFHEKTFRDTYPYLEIWTPDGVIAYSNSSQLIGHDFADPPGLVRALTGEVAAEYADLDAPEHTMRQFDTKYLEIYSPIRDVHGRIVGVAEIHETGDLFAQQTRGLIRLTWALVCGATLLILASLYGVVRQGGRTIERQSEALRKRITEIQRISEQNQALKERAQLASARVAELNEQYLKRIGADLHDGPLQLLGFGVLQTSNLAKAIADGKCAKPLRALAATLDQAIAEIRTISKGLLIPNLEGSTLRSIIENVAKVHRARFGEPVALALADVDRILPSAVTTCVYRFVQEGLANAYQHASGRNQRIKCRLHDKVLIVTVTNGEGQQQESAVGREEHAPRQGMGLFGLRNRIESLGGTLSFTLTPGVGATLEMRLELGSDVAGH